MRLISFSLTTPQFIAGTKDVTRRMGWKFLQPGDRLRGVKKAMGLKRGEHPEDIGIIRIVSVRREPLSDILRPGYGEEEVRREGFPEMTPERFMLFYMAHHAKCTKSTMVTRIEFERIADAQAT